MNRNEFIIATAIILFTAFILGWLVSWLVLRLSRVTPTQMDELDDMAQKLHEADEERHRAIRVLELREAQLIEELGRTKNELLLAKGNIKESQAEIEELREYIDRQLGRKS
ncbi:hypothetical protein [Paracoccus aestuariivivens]|uniref:Uncharacterized protein n=1 Tax=Paracoccus aestuariivivens TaxID=1820333 RepID=A0A6L6JBV9_9RHOB|nr:hypothetical protein [Paracoccus aestuariivivens]MTH77654.1 hypothetical protein [Paracoccus aestuariivivens]